MRVLSNAEKLNLNLILRCIVLAKKGVIDFFPVGCPWVSSASYSRTWPPKNQLSPAATKELATILFNIQATGTLGFQFSGVFEEWRWLSTIPVEQQLYFFQQLKDYYVV